MARRRLAGSEATAWALFKQGCPREKESLFRFLKQGSDCLGCAIGYRFDVCWGHLSSLDSVSPAVVNACDDGNDTGTVQALLRDCRKQQKQITRQCKIFR